MINSGWKYLEQANSAPYSMANIPTPRFLTLDELEAGTTLLTPASSGKILQARPILNNNAQSLTMVDSWTVNKTDPSVTFKYNASTKQLSTLGGSSVVNLFPGSNPTLYFASPSNALFPDNFSYSGADGTLSTAQGVPYNPETYYMQGDTTGVNVPGFGRVNPYGTFPNPLTAPSRWIALDTAVNCCMTDSKIVEQDYQLQCSPSYDPGQPGNVCPTIVADYCQDFWGSSSPQVQNKCRQFIGAQSWTSNFPNVSRTVQNMVINYIASRPNSQYPDQDYTPARDSNDPFFTTYMPELCTLPQGTIAPPLQPGPCDAILTEYCKGFTRQQVQADPVLQKLCGCHLSNLASTSDYVKPALCSDTGQCLDIKAAPVALQYPYGTAECDPVCNSDDTVPNYSRPACAETVCLITDVNINQIKSQGNVDFNLICNSCGGNGGCSCYISNVVVNEIDSNASVHITQNCGKCFKFTNSFADAVEVPCESFTPPTPCECLGIPWWLLGVAGAVILVIVLAVLAWWWIHRRERGPRTTR